MIKKYISVIILLFVIPFYSQEKFANKTIDSLIIVLRNTNIDTSKAALLNKISLKFSDLDPNKGIEFANQALKLSKKINWNDGIANAYFNIAKNNYDLGNMNVASDQLAEAIKNGKNTKILAQIYLLNTSVCTSTTNYVKAFEYCSKALKLYLKSNNKLGQANVHNAIAKIYYCTNETKKAIHEFNKSIVLNTELNNKENICKNLEGIGLTYYDISQYDKAMYYYLKAMTIAKQTNNQKSLTFIYYSIGKNFLDQNLTKQALTYIIKARTIAEAINYTRLLNAVIFLEASTYIKLYTSNSQNKNYNLLNKAEALLLNMIAISKKNNILTNQSTALRELSNLYTLKKKHKKAKEIYILYADLKDSIYNEDSKESIQNLEDRLTIDQKNNEIKINKIILVAKEKQKYFFIAGLLLFGAIGCLLYYQSKNRKKTNEKLQVLNNDLDQANKVKARFFSILNHDLRSPVNNLIHYLYLQKESPELLDEFSKEQIESETLTSAENLLGSMEDILLWSKGQMENFKPKFENNLISKIFSDTQKHFSSESKICILFENPENLKILTDENYLKTIIRNLTGNAIKALAKTPNPIITWKGWQENGQNYLSVKDNGTGADQEQFKALYDEKVVVGIQSGLGLHLIRDLAKAINCEISVDSKENIGTIFTLKL